MVSNFLSNIYTYAITGIWPQTSTFVTPWDGSPSQLMNIVNSQIRAGASKSVILLTFLAGNNPNRGSALCPSCPLTRHVLRQMASRNGASSQPITFLEINCSEQPEICKARHIKRFPFIEMLIISPSLTGDLQFVAIPFTPKYDISRYGFEVFFQEYL
jgi:hypothetical protein